MGPDIQDFEVEKKVVCKQWAVLIKQKNGSQIVNRFFCLNATKN